MVYIRNNLNDTSLYSFVDHFGITYCRCNFMWCHMRHKSIHDVAICKYCDLEGLIKQYMELKRLDQQFIKVHSYDSDFDVINFTYDDGYVLREYSPTETTKAVYSRFDSIV